MNRALSNKVSLAEGQGIVVASCSLMDLFSGKAIQTSKGTRIQGHLHVPEYQRPYRWGGPEIGRLLKDLAAYFDSCNGANPPQHDFFLGSVILHQQAQEEALNIIDGQQRLTTMGLLAWLKNPLSAPNLSYASPTSQQQIQKNILWLKGQSLQWNRFDLSRINIVLVVTRSEDDAYRFFETQNTGGVRLGGPDIIKAHHLRAIASKQQNEYARLWERLGDLNPIVRSVLMARYWQALEFRELPSRRQKQLTRSAIVEELAERTIEDKEDLSYCQMVINHMEDGRLVQECQAGSYAIRQPLNAGVNTIHVLHYFESLRQQLLGRNSVYGSEAFRDFYCGLIGRAEGCAYLKELYDSCLLVYVSHFGHSRLYEAALWLFRMVYSRRVSNLKTVRENSVGALVSESPVFDWIIASYTHTQCIERLKSFRYKVSPENLGPEEVSVKKRFVTQVNTWFQLDLPKEQISELYDYRLMESIAKKVGTMRLIHE